MKRSAIFVVQITFLIVLCSITVSSQEEVESRIINKIPSHVPLRVEIRNGGLDSNLEDVEIKITNTGTRPIYYLSLTLASAEEFMPRNRVGLGTSLKIGNPKLADYSRSASHFETERANTVPFAPQDSRIFFIAKQEAEGFWKVMNDKGYPTDSKLVLEIQNLSFGDRTGYFTRDAIEMPKPALNTTEGARFFFR